MCIRDSPWVTTTLRKTGAALPAGVTRAQWLLFGHGTASGVKAVVADQVWGAALGAINGLTYGLVKDGVEFMPAAAVKMARSTVVRAAAADLARTRCDGAALTRAAWAARWSGLARLRRDAAKFATGCESLWPRPAQIGRRSRRSGPCLGIARSLRGWLHRRAAYCLRPSQTKT